MNEIDRLCFHNQQVIDTANELSTELASAKPTYPILALQPLLANLLSTVANLLAFKGNVFYPHRKKYLAAEDYNLVDAFTKELSLTHQSVSAYRNQWSNYYRILNNHAECLTDTKVVLNSIVKLVQYEIDCVAPILNKEATKKEMIMHPVNHNNVRSETRLALFLRNL
jgi:hypothetical protein